MAGRGRGGGLSLTQDQLQALGIGRGDITPPPLVPPPLFPKLERKPLPLISDAATDYMLVVKDQFIEYLHESPAYVKPRSQTDGVERYSDKYKLLALDTARGKTLDCVWSHMPTELKPHAAKVRPTRVNRKRKLDDPEVITKRLQTLEKKEFQETSDEVMEKNEETEKKDDENDDEELEDEQEQDYEIDDGTDYGNNYFDNGEEFDEEDENLDDGPVY